MLPPRKIFLVRKQSNVMFSSFLPLILKQADVIPFNPQATTFSATQQQHISSVFFLRCDATLKFLATLLNMLHYIFYSSDHTKTLMLTMITSSLVPSSSSFASSIFHQIVCRMYYYDAVTYLGNVLLIVAYSAHRTRKLCLSHNHTCYVLTSCGNNARTDVDKY